MPAKREVKPHTRRSAHDTRDGAHGGPERPSRHDSLLALQRSVGNHHLSRLLAANVSPSAPAHSEGAHRTLFRDVDSAAAALRGQGIITVKNSHLTSKFLREHSITKSQLSEIQVALDLLRAQAPSTSTTTTVDLTDQSNWPTTGGMREDEATIVANYYDWTETTESFRCTDPSHTPKGRVYINDQGGYLGADNTGHVGWGFKIWSKVRKGFLKYEGNMVWNGSAWTVNGRGT